MGRAGRPVISVGNITLGGTGKTPIVSKLVSWLLEKGVHPAVVSRGYGGNYSGVACVDDPRAFKRFGDEPCLLKGWHPHVPIYLCPRRIQACRELLQRETVDVIVADDAFQHESLYRDIDFVVIDALEPLSNYQVVPAGRSREPLRALERADYVIINKSNLASSRESLDLLQELLKPYVECPIFYSHYVARELICLPWDGYSSATVEAPPQGGVHRGKEVAMAGSPLPFSPLGRDEETGRSGASQSLLWKGRALLLSGIGHPQSFEELVTSMGIEVGGHLKYPDHHLFKRSDIDKAIRLRESLGTERILVTEKDAIKIAPLLSHASGHQASNGDVLGSGISDGKVLGGADCIWSLGLTVQFDSSWETLQEKIFQRISQVG